MQQESTVNITTKIKGSPLDGEMIVRYDCYTRMNNWVMWAVGYYPVYRLARDQVFIRTSQLTPFRSPVMDEIIRHYRCEPSSDQTRSQTLG